MQKVLHETCRQYLQRRLSEGWKITEQKGFNVILQSPEGLIRPVDLRNDVETLRPDAAGDETSIPNQYPDSTYHWDKVDEASPDDLSTYVESSSSIWRRDLYNLPASSGSGTINGITVYFRCYVMGTLAREAKASIKSDSTVTDGTAKTFDASYTWYNFSQVWATNPADSAAWEWADIDTLQIGVSLYAADVRCTQVYVEVDYTPAVVAPTVTTQAADNITFTDSKYHGNITDNGSENCDYRGFVWDASSHGDPGNVAPASTDYTYNWTEGNSYGTGVFEHITHSLRPNHTYYVRACAHNSAGWSYGGEVNFTTKTSPLPTSYRSS